MIKFFTNVFEYHYKINERLINQMLDNIENVSEKANLLLCHSINAHQIWNSRIANEKSLGVFEIYPLTDCIDLNKSNFETTILILQNEDLQKTILYQNSKGLVYENTIQDILFHISNHYSHHRGQLISELKQTDIEPIVSDYIFHKRSVI